MFKKKRRSSDPNVQTPVLLLNTQLHLQSQTSPYPGSPIPPSPSPSPTPSQPLRTAQSVQTFVSRSKKRVDAVTEMDPNRSYPTRAHQPNFPASTSYATIGPTSGYGHNEKKHVGGVVGIDDQAKVKSGPGSHQSPAARVAKGIKSAFKNMRPGSSSSSSSQQPAPFSPSLSYTGSGSGMSPNPSTQSYSPYVPSPSPSPIPNSRFIFQHSPSINDDSSITSSANILPTHIPPPLSHTPSVVKRKKSFRRPRTAPSPSTFGSMSSSTEMSFQNHHDQEILSPSSPPSYSSHGDNFAFDPSQSISTASPTMSTTRSSFGRFGEYRNVAANDNSQGGGGGGGGGRVGSSGGDRGGGGRLTKEDWTKCWDDYLQLAYERSEEAKRKECLAGGGSGGLHGGAAFGRAMGGMRGLVGGR